MIDSARDLPVRLGQVLATPGAMTALLKAFPDDPNAGALSLLVRHSSGDWGDVCKEDWSLNDEATKVGSRILSSYKLTTGITLWIITEADRSATTLLLPAEY